VPATVPAQGGGGKRCSRASKLCILNITLFINNHNNIVPIVGKQISIRVDV